MAIVLQATSEPLGFAAEAAAKGLGAREVDCCSPGKITRPKLFATVNVPGLPRLESPLYSLG